MWKQTEHPGDKLVIATQVLQKKCKLEETGRGLAHTSCFVANGNDEKEGIQYQESRSLTPTAGHHPVDAATVTNNYVSHGL